MPKQIAHSLKLLAVAVLAVLLGGCSGGSSTSQASAPLSVSAKTPAGMTVTLSENTSVVPVGGDVTYTLTLTNPTLHAVAFDLQAGCLENVEPKTFGDGLSGQVSIYGPQGQLLNDFSC